MRDVGIDYPPGAEGGKLWSMRHIAGTRPATRSSSQAWTLRREVKVLIVEDEPMVAEVAERHLRRDSYDVRRAGSGRVAHLRNSPPFNLTPSCSKAAAGLALSFTS